MLSVLIVFLPSTGPFSCLSGEQGHNKLGSVRDLTTRAVQHDRGQELEFLNITDLRGVYVGSGALQHFFLTRNTLQKHYSMMKKGFFCMLGGIVGHINLCIKGISESDSFVFKLGLQNLAVIHIWH